jgi:hypothetical protein
MLLECNWLARESFKFLIILGDKFAPDGVMANDI